MTNCGTRNHEHEASCTDGIWAHRSLHCDDRSITPTVINDWFSRFLTVAATQILDPTVDVIAEVNADAGSPDRSHQVCRTAQQIVLRQDVCEKCHQLLDAVVSASSAQFDRRYTTIYIESAASAGCRFCGLMQSSLKTLGYLEVLQKLEQRFTLVPTYNIIGTIAVESLWSGDEITLGLTIADSNRYCGDKSCHYMAMFGTTEPRESETSNDPFMQCKRWLGMCASSHKCLSAYSGSRNPSRLLSIKDTLRLVETTTWEAQRAYATLSYCWGDAPRLKLTETTYHDFLEDIPYDSLPLTYQHAITVARALDIDWLWIDAMCIIQDQEHDEDFLAESAIMGDIYGGGTVNFAASMAPDVGSGMLCGSHSPLTGIDVRISGKPKYLYLMEAWHFTVNRSHLGTRGWAFQERLLAPRTLYLGDFGLYWECSQHAGSQHGPIPRYERIRDNLCLGRQQAWNWQQLIGRYSRTTLTRKDDRLIAISGLAKCQQQLTGDNYLAGLWQTSFVHQLMWHTTEPSLSIERRIPTWSWVSIDQCVLWNYRDFAEAVVDLVCVDIELVNRSDPFGAVVSATVQLTCSVLYTAEVLQDIEDQLKLLGFNTRMVYNPDCIDESPQHSEDVVYVLPIAWEELHLRGHSLTIRSLMLKKCQHDTFRRIGLVEMSFQHASLEQHNLLKKHIREVGETCAALVCTETTEDGRNMISIA